MFSQVMAVVSWVGIACFLWSVSDSLAKIASAMRRDSTPVAGERPDLT